jgi:hypothetical protein
LGLVRAVSIGFQAAADKITMLKGGGIQYDEYEILELSAVTIPANVDASIHTIRAIYHNLRAASGKQPQAVIPAASGHKDKPAGVSASRSIKLEATTMATTTNAERMKQLEARRAAEMGARDAIQETVAKEDRTKDESEVIQFDEHQSKISSIDRELRDCRLIEKELINTAKPLSNEEGVEMHSSVIQVKAPTLPPGLGLIKRLACQLHADLYHRDVVAVARQYCAQWPQIEMDIKAAVATGTVASATWAGNLVYAQNLASEFLEFLVPQTYLGRIPGLTRVPFNSRIPRENSVITAQWVGEGASKPVAAGTFDTVTLTFAKTACIMGVTDELARFSSPSVEMLVRDNLAKGIAKFLDEQFIKPTVTAVTNVSPASITNGADTDSASGTDITAVIHDIRQILFHFQEYNIPTDNLTLIMQPVLATSIGTMLTTLGVVAFPNVNGNGGNILGITVLTSNNSPAGQVTAIHPPSVFVADEGGLQIDVSREASVELDSAPAAGNYHLVSAFQNNLVFVRAERYITWMRGRDKGVFYLTSAAYGGAVTG